MKLNLVLFSRFMDFYNSKAFASLSLFILMLSAKYNFFYLFQFSETWHHESEYLR